ncbi:MAG TPA: hypothetical protein VG944_06730 [Fimbriimonas sp.]|nr:hypothetical protein [Fimbriimonas sp.]
MRIRWLLASVLLFGTLSYLGLHEFSRRFASHPLILKEVPSPDGMLKAVVFTTDCGVPCEMDNSVSVVMGDQDLSESEKIVASSPGPSQYQPRLKGSKYPTWVDVVWTGKRSIEVTYIGDCRIDQFLPGDLGQDRLLQERNREGFL